MKGHNHSMFNFSLFFVSLGERTGSSDVADSFAGVGSSSDPVPELYEWRTNTGGWTAAHAGSQCKLTFVLTFSTHLNLKCRFVFKLEV